jgi:UDP-glucuronate decarboxylase
MHYQADPLATVSTNVLGAFNVLETARRSHARVLQASTSEVYGDPEVHPQHEDYWGHVSCTGPRACYDESKRVAETLFFDSARRRGVDIRVARIFNTYGPRMRPDDGRVVSNFIGQALAGEPLTIYGDGSQTRSFCYIDDLVEGLIRLMETDVPAAPVNLGNPEEFTVRDLATRILALVGSDAGVVYRDLPQDDPRQRRPDIGRARQLLGWQPKVRLGEGLDRTVAYFRALRERQGKTRAA